MTIPCETISENEIDLIAYSKDASGIEGRALKVCWPKHKEELRAVVHYCKRNRIQISVRGSGTGLFGGAVPNNSLVIDMSKMRRVFEITDEYALVEAGACYYGLSKAIAKHTNRAFPIEPVNPSSSIGGMIATNAGNIKGEAIQDFILEFWGVNGEGKFLKLPPDLIGTEGSLAIITHAKIRLKEEQARTMDIFSYNTYTALAKAVREFQEKKEEYGISNIEYVDGSCSKIFGWGDNLHLAVEYNKNEEQTNKTALSEKETKAFWKRRKALFYEMLGKQINFEKLWLPTEKLDIFLYWLGKNGIPALGHLGKNIVHPFYNPKSQSWNEIIETAKKLGAVPVGPFGLARKSINPDIENIRMAKATYDPGLVLNSDKA
ncbi:FAD-binding oxidoreductase [archaeon]|nr:FAD-binding oxidoreductase [archaeon]